MPFDFPSAPTNGQEYAPAGGPVYVWQAPTWVLKPAPVVNHLTQAQADTLYVNVAGDVMVGMLTLPSTAPTAAQHAVSKGFVDAHTTRTDNPHGTTAAQVGAISQAQADGLYVNVLGDTMGGPLILTASEQTGVNHAATRSYVDAHATRTDNPHGTTAAQTGALTTTTGDVRYLPKSGGALSGSLTMTGYGSSGGVDYATPIYLGGSWGNDIILLRQIHQPGVKAAIQFVVGSPAEIWEMRNNGEFYTRSLSVSAAANVGTLNAANNVNAANLITTGLVRASNGVYALSNDDFGFFQSGNYRYFRWTGGWYDHFDMATGNRAWVNSVGSGLMTLGGGGNLWSSNGYSTPGNIGAGYIDSSGTVAGNYVYSRGDGRADGNWSANIVTGNAVNSNGNMAATNGTMTAQQLTSNGNANIAGTTTSNVVTANYIRSNGDISVGGTVTANVVNCNGGTVYGNFNINNQLWCREYVGTGGTFYMRGNATDIGGNGSGWQMFLSGSSRYIRYAGDGWDHRWDAANGNWHWNSNTRELLRLQGDGTLVLASDGAYKPGGGAWWDSSDARIKTELSEYTSGLEAVLALRPMNYRFRGNDGEVVPAAKGSEVQPTPQAAHDSERDYIGLIAQEAELVMPELVGLRDGWIDGQPVDDMRTLDPSALTYALINCVKELVTQIDKLHLRIKALEAEALS